jgi:hypothetical protein
MLKKVLKCTLGVHLGHSGGILPAMLLGTEGTDHLPRQAEW